MAKWRATQLSRTGRLSCPGSDAGGAKGRPGRGAATPPGGAGWGVPWWWPHAALSLAGVTWVSSSGVRAMMLGDLGRLGNRETPAVLVVLVMEDRMMALYLPLLTALVAGGSTGSVLVTVSWWTT